MDPNVTNNAVKRFADVGIGVGFLQPGNNFAGATKVNESQFFNEADPAGGLITSSPDSPCILAGYKRTYG